MSRVGKKPISIPANTKIVYKDRSLVIEGKNGKLSRTLHPDVDLKIDQGVVNVQLTLETKNSRALQGLADRLLERSPPASLQGGLKFLWQRIQREAAPAA